MDEQSLILQSLVSNLDLLAVARYTLTYVVCFYDWVMSLDEEVVFVSSAPWNIVKVAYLCCRYYPLAVAPFHLWGFLGDHEQHVCESYLHALSACTIPPPLFTLAMSVVSSVLLMWRTYAFSGRKKGILAVLSITLSSLVGFMIWVSWKQIILSPLFLVVERTSCLGITDPQTFKIVQVASGIPGISSVQAPFAYHLGVRLGHSRAFLWLYSHKFFFLCQLHCFRQRRTLGPLSQSILKQGIFIYIFMTILNMLTFGTFFSSRVLYQARAVGPWFAYILPSALVIVLMLRREASPTETKLRSRYSHIVNEALEMVTVESYPEETSEETALSVSKDAHARL
ncbi:hypothetical protein EDB85DRAFT_1996429 [Lactarius pseudohatsudake]|nr:hypothetical protein EDB85DRAFT_1996429 [Lactarius pseudohatsudake]